MNRATADVVVVGMGPAGASAAIALARAGRQVIAIDKARFPRDKACGDGLTAAALRPLRALGLEVEALPSAYRAPSAVLTGPKGKAVEILFPARTELAWIVRRFELDAALVDLARAAGATVMDGNGLGALAADFDRLTVHVTDVGSIEARYVIAADGMWSPTRRLLATSEPSQRGEWMAMRQYFTDVSPRASRELAVWFEPDLLPGYVWSFPLACRTANVGFGIRRGRVPTGQLSAVWADLLERPALRDFLGPAAIPQSPHRAWPIPTGVRRETLSEAGGRVLFAGDAAKAADPMTGEGIGQALETGLLAARSIIEAGEHDAKRARHLYCSWIANGLGIDDRFAAALSDHILAHRKGVRAALRVLGSPAFRTTFGRWLFEDHPRLLIGGRRRRQRIDAAIPRGVAGRYE